MKAIDLVAKTVQVDWGWTVNSHPLPQAIVDDPNMAVTQMRELIAELRPELPDYMALTAALRELIELRVGTDLPVVSVNFNDHEVHNQDVAKEF